MIRRKKRKVKEEERGAGCGGGDEFMVGRDRTGGYSKNFFTLMDWNSKELMKFLLNFFYLIPLSYTY